MDVYGTVKVKRMEGEARRIWHGLPHYREIYKTHRYVRTPAYLILIIFIAVTGYTAGSIFWIMKKDNEVEKYRRLEIELQNRIKDRELTIQQNHQQIEQLERRVEIFDAIKELSREDLPEKDQRKIAYVVDEESRKYGYDPLFLLAFMSTESAMRPWAKSLKGASGLMQLMPHTGKALVESIYQEPKLLGLEEGQEFSFAGMRDIESNIQLGTLYLTQLMVRYNSLKEAIYAYNLGPVLFEKRRHNGGPMPEKYLAKVMTQYHLLLENREKRANPLPTLAELDSSEVMLAQADSSDP